jgi:hypothetical protein
MTGGGNIVCGWRRFPRERTTDFADDADATGKKAGSSRSRLVRRRFNFERDILSFLYL